MFKAAVVDDVHQEAIKEDENEKMAEHIVVVDAVVTSYTMKLSNHVEEKRADVALDVHPEERK